MTALDIRLFGDPVLRTVADEVTDPSDPTLRTLVSDMLETMDAQSVHVTGVTVDGEPVDREVSGLLARCVQHETDHLDGVMFFQRMAADDRRTVMSGIRESEWFNR